MEVPYNFSQHLYCASIFFDEKKIYTKYFANGIKQGINRGNYVEESASILYRVLPMGRDVIVFTGAEADDKRGMYASNSYVDSVFFELHDLYQKNQNTNNVHYTTIIQAATTLLEKVKTRSPFTNNNGFVQLSNYHFAVTLPTDWNNEVQEKLIRPLFVKAGLISKTDHPDKLLFFSQLQSDFRYLQSLDNYELKIISKKIVNRKEYHTCILTFTENNLLVNMDLFSAYCPLSTTGSDPYDAKLLNSASFTVALDYSRRRCIDLYIKIESFNINTAGVRELGEVTRFISEHDLTLSVCGSSLTKLIELQHKLDNSTIGYGFSQEEEEVTPFMIRQIRQTFAVVLGDISVKIFYPIEQSFWSTIKSLYSFNTNITYKAILIFRDMRATRRDTTSYEFLLKWLEEILKTNHYYEIITFGNNSSAFHRVPIGHILLGTANQIMRHVQKSNEVKEPLEIAGNKTEGTSMISLAPLFVNSAPIFIINIDINFDAVKFVCTYMGDDASVVSTTGYSECNVMPLSHFFVTLNNYQRPALFVDTRMRQFMGSKYCHLFEMLSNVKECPLEDLLVTNGKNDKSCFFKSGITKKPIQLKDKLSAVFMYHQKRYVYLFLVMYLRYIYNSVTKKLNESFRHDWIDKNIGYVISVEKMLLDDVFGSKKKLQEILYEIDMIQETNHCRKARILSQEEGILPIIQQALDLPFSLRSYSAVVQLHENCMQITLHQIVKLTEPSGEFKYVTVDDKKVLLKNVSDIIVRDEIIPIQNTYDAMCISILNHIKCCGAIENCVSHKNHASNGLYSLKNYKPGLEKLKQQIVDILSTDLTSLNSIDKQLKIKFGHECDCCFYSSLRNIIDVGFKPSLQTLATTVAASISNTSLFGNYDLDYIFVFGDLYNLSKKEILHKIYTRILQEAINTSIKTKPTSAEGFVFGETSSQLLHPVIPFLGNIFTTGKLHQASSESYGIYIGALNEPFAREHSLSVVDPENNDIHTTLCKNFAKIVLQKGQLIPIAGWVKKFKMNFMKEYEEEEEEEDSYEVLEIAVIRLRNSEIIREEIISLDDLSYDKISTISIGSEQLVTGMYIYLEIKPNNYNSSLQFSLRLNGSDKEYRDDNGCLVLEELLTVAYF